MKDSLDKFLLIKRGLYYRPNAHGYTSDLAKAGLYSEAEAKERVDNVAGVTMKPLSLCLKEIDQARAALRGRITELDKLEREALGLR